MCGTDDPSLQLIDHDDGNGVLCVYCHQEANDLDLPHNRGCEVDVYCEMCGGDGELIDHGDGNGYICAFCRDGVRDEVLRHCCDVEIEPESEQDPVPPSPDPEPEPTSDHDEEPESNDAKRRRLG